MNRKFVSALSKYINFHDSILNSPFSKIVTDGYIHLHGFLDETTCDILANDTLDLYSRFKSKNPSLPTEGIAEVGCLRSPFVFSSPYRDLLLSEYILNVRNIFFPCNSILHLNRSIISSPSCGQSVSPMEIHRDMPYLHTPSYAPLSLSFLFFFSESLTSQLGIFEHTHNSQFYNLEASFKELDTSRGSLLIFDSNLLHCSLTTSSVCIYTLFMFTVPLIKPVISYTSKNVINQIDQLRYRNEDVFDIIGYKYNPPSDDDELIARKLTRLDHDRDYYTPVDLFDTIT